MSNEVVMKVPFEKLVRRIVDYVSHDMEWENEAQRIAAVDMYVEHIMSNQFTWIIEKEP